MTTAWLYRINYIIPSSSRSMINALWTIIAPEGDSEAKSFGVPLSATGEEPSTHLGISSACTTVMKAHIEDTFAAELAGAIINIQDKDVNDWEQLLATHGLKVIRPPWEV